MKEVRKVHYVKGVFVCPKCRQSYSDPTLQYCLEDGGRLVDRLDAADSDATHILPGGTAPSPTVPGSRDAG